MYLQNDGDGVPKLRLRIDEPILLSQWSNNTPFSTMTDLWKLSNTKQQIWWDHFCKSILTPNYGRSIVNAAGETVGGAVIQDSVIVNRNLFSEWMYSSQDTSLFKKVKLRKFVEEVGEVSTLFLAPDVLCSECDHEEPAWLYYGTGDNSQKFHEQYKFIADVFKNSIFDSYLDMSSCHRCNDQKYVTPNMRRFARHRPGLCECMPCRRGL